MLSDECIQYWRNVIKYSHPFTKEDVEGYKNIGRLLDKVEKEQRDNPSNPNT